MKKHIAIFDLSITANSPAGSCVLQLIKSLANEYQFIVFSDQFENPAPQNITWIRVPLPSKPVIARYIIFRYMAPIYYKRFLRQHPRPDLVISTEGEFPECDVCYVHFCHRDYLRKKALQLSSVRSVVRFLTHQFNARSEALAIRHARNIVVPSAGLADDLLKTYKFLDKSNIVAIANPLDVEYFTRPISNKPSNLRQKLGFDIQDIVLVFTALGNFEHKGLPLILQALSTLKSSHLKLLVIGGSTSEVQDYTKTCKHLDISEQVLFAGFQSDIRPYLWISDLFILPSLSETFSLATFQAAIASLPVMVTQLYGVSSFLESDVNGWLVNRDAKAIAQKLDAIDKGQYNLSKMGIKAHNAAAKYGIPQFVERWRLLLNAVLQRSAALSTANDSLSKR